MEVPDMAQSNDALLIQVDPRLNPMCMFVPRQLTRGQMTSLFLESWITNYEELHQAVKSIQSNNPLRPHQIREMWQFSKPRWQCFNLCHMFVKMALKLKHFMKMEILAMKENHHLATYGGIFVIVMHAKRSSNLRWRLTMKKEEKIVLTTPKREIWNRWSRSRSPWRILLEIWVLCLLS